MYLLYTDLMQHFPWGGKLTSESIMFFSPIVIWTKFTSSPQKYVVYSAFRDYYKVLIPSILIYNCPCYFVILLSWWPLAFQIWLELIDTTVKETDEYQIFDNLEAQHRYLTWRAEKVVWIYLKLLSNWKQCRLIVAISNLV